MDRQAKKFKLTPMQESMLFTSINLPSSYITTLRYELPEGASAQSLKDRLDLLTKRHEALRTFFVRDAGGGVWQEVAERAEVDFYEVSDDSQTAHIDPFGKPLVKFALCGSELFVTFHHALLDGWSVNILVRELLSAQEPEGAASPFRYYVKWLLKRADASDLSWWRGYVMAAGVSSPPNRLASDGYERRELRFSIDNSKLLYRRAKELSITQGRLLQTVWCMLLARYNGGESVVCCVNSGRSAPVPGIMGMVGMCVNTLPIATRLPEPPESLNFAEWVHKWSKSAAEAEKRGFCSLTDIINCPVTHILSIEPSFEAGGAKLKESKARLVSDFDAVFFLNSEKDGGIGAEFAYNARAYTVEAVEAVKGHFLTALDAILENPEIPVEQIPILTKTEVSALLSFNDDKEILEIIGRETVVDFWKKAAKENESRPAVVCGNTRLTYAELIEKVNRLVYALAAKGVVSETPVAILLERSERYVAAELAVLSAGGFFIPLDMSWPKERIKAVMDVVKPKMVIDGAKYEELLASGTPLKVALSLPNPHDAAYMIMTSGTTGIPKGAIIEHRSLANFCLWAKSRYGWRAGASCAVVLGFAFDGSLWDIFLPLISGGALHILDDDVRFGISKLGKYCAENRITHIDLPVAMANAFREAFGSENAPASPEIMVTGGEEVRHVVPAPYPLSNEYGPTECTVCCCMNMLESKSFPVSIGLPMPNTAVYILDEWKRLCPEGVIGEAYISGVQLARGYYGSPELTAEFFSTNPFAVDNENHQIFYRTGDLMKWGRSDGERALFFAGRIDTQVKINGFRVEPGEIESVLRTHTEVGAAVACVKETAGGENRLCAYVRAKPGIKLDITELDSLLASKLPYFMCAEIIPVDNIPLNTSGKVDYRLLPPPKAGTATAYAEPVSERQKALVSAVRRILRVPDAGITHSFLELGGNSISAMRTAFYLEKEGWEITAGEIIASASIAEAAGKMRRAAHGPEHTESRPCSFTPLDVQKSMIYLAEKDGNAQYTVNLRIDATGVCADTLSPRLLKAASLHDILRTTFEYDSQGNVIGRVHDNYEIPLHISEALPETGINPLRDPLLEVSLSGEELAVRYHHIILDGYSISLLLEEILRGKFPKAAPSFAEFANRIASHRQMRVDDAAWWRKARAETVIVPLLPPASDEKPVYRRVTLCPTELLSKCAKAARTSRVTMAAFTLAAWGQVLSMFAGENNKKFIVPYVASFRDDEGLMGMCVSAHPLIFNHPRGNDFGKQAAGVQNAIIESMRHMYAPPEIIREMPGYLFVFEEAEEGYDSRINAGGESNYDLVVRFSSKGEIIYNEKRVSAELARFIAKRLEAALAAAIDGKTSVFYKGEYERVTKAFARGRSLNVKYKTAAEAISAAAEKYAGHIALETENERLTYSELYGKAKSLADKLNEKGLGAGDIAAFCFPREAEGIIVQIGITMAGAAFLPIDPLWPEARIHEILADSGAAALIMPGLNIELKAGCKTYPDTAYVIYTSGSSGKPKGVLIPNSALANQLAWTLAEFGFCPEDKMLHYIPFTFDPSVWTIFSTLVSGATLSLLNEDARLDPNAVAAYIAEKNVTLCVLPAAIGGEILRRVNGSRLRIAFLGGETSCGLPPRTGGLELVNLYGPTEACVNATFYRMKPDETETRCIGKPVANTSCYVLNSDGTPCPEGIRGELHIGGVQLAHGYVNRPEENEKAFNEHPLFGRLYKTGDTVSWSFDETLTFHGRNDRQVKIRGNRVELSEIENALSLIPEISDAKVKLTGDSVDAYVIAEENAVIPEASAIRRTLSKRLPSYMLPRTITRLNAFPLTERQKVDFTALPAPEERLGSGSAGNLTETEAAIAKAWKTVLKLKSDYILSGLDNFFELGGHSLLLFQVVGALAASNVTADIRILASHSVLSELAAEVDRRKSVAAKTPATVPSLYEEQYRQYIRELELLNISEKYPLNSILITGGTGFLGSHLVREFYNNTSAEIYLPVRGGIKRLGDALSFYFGQMGADIAISNRLNVFSADISEKPPAPIVPLDLIIHAAADIRHYAPEADMYRANVTATENMLELAKGCGAFFAHISTTSAVNAPVIYENVYELGGVFENIYQRTKQLAERRVLDSGLNCSIFRVGHISPGFKTGTFARNSEINATLQILGSILQTGLLPDNDGEIGFGFVDETARAVRLLTGAASLEGRIYHLDNPIKIRLAELFRRAEAECRTLSRNELIKKLRELTKMEDEKTRRAATDYLGRISQGGLEKKGSDILSGELRMDATLLLLKRLGFEWPEVSDEYVKGVFKYIKNLNL